MGRNNPITSPGVPQVRNQLQTLRTYGTPEWINQISELLMLNLYGAINTKCPVTHIFPRQTLRWKIYFLTPKPTFQVNPSANARMVINSPCGFR